jgi:hypothetical protein
MLLDTILPARTLLFHIAVRAPAQTGEMLRMKVSYNEDLANHIDSESCVVVGNCEGEALTGGDTGRVLSRENMKPVRGADAVDGSGRRHLINRYREINEDPARSETPCMYPSISCGSREIPRLAGDGIPVRIGNSKEVIR